MKQLTNEQISEMRTVRTNLVSSYSARDEMLKVYDEIYFMGGEEKPKGLKIQDEDIKVTISSSGRDAVTGLKRILDSGEVQIKVTGQGGNPDKVEAGLKAMLRSSGRYKIASVEKDLNLSAALHGPASLAVELVDDLLETMTVTPDASAYEGEGKRSYKNEYVAKQLELLREETPFLLHPVSAPQSYPLWGGYGMIGHCRKYTLKGAEITDRWGVVCKDPTKTYDVTDFFYYERRLVEAEGISEPLMAVEWVSRDEKTGEMIGSINIPVFTRFSGGSSLWHEPDKQSQPLLYAKAKGGWHKRENLAWTYLFTGIDQQGIPGPIVLIDPESVNDEIEIDYRRGIRTIKAKGTLADPQVIDGDVLKLFDLMKGEAATQTVQPQTLGQNTAGVTFSQFALASKAGLIPAIDPKEAMEALYEDAFTHILQRIKAESIENEVIAPGDIPEKVKLTVTLEPDLEQDDLRNAQIASQLKASGANVSDEWIDTNLLKVADSKAMWRQKKKEELRNQMVEMLKDPQFMGQFMGQIMGSMLGGKGKGGQGSDQSAVNGGPPTVNSAVPGMMPGGEAMPKTDAVIPLEERT